MSGKKQLSAKRVVLTVLVVLLVAAAVGFLISIPYAENDPVLQAKVLQWLKVYICAPPVIGIVRTWMGEERKTVKIALTVVWLISLIVIIRLEAWWP